MILPWLTKRKKTMIGTMIAESAQLCLRNAEKLFAGIPDEKFARFSSVGGKVIQSNHPAFICGHLSLYPSRVVGELGGDASSISPTPKYEELFSPQATCLDDPDAKLYPHRDELIERFQSAHQAAIDVLRDVDDSKFDAVNPNERMRSMFSTMGSMHAFYLGGHLMLHLGQLSAWRRVMGMPPV